MDLVIRRFSHIWCSVPWFILCDSYIHDIIDLSYRLTKRDLLFLAFTKWILCVCVLPCYELLKLKRMSQINSRKSETKTHTLKTNTQKRKVKIHWIRAKKQEMEKQSSSGRQKPILVEVRRRPNISMFVFKSV